MTPFTTEFRDLSRTLTEFTNRLEDTEDSEVDIKTLVRLGDAATTVDNALAFGEGEWRGEEPKWVKGELIVPNRSPKYRVTEVMAELDRVAGDWDTLLVKYGWTEEDAARVREIILSVELKPVPDAELRREGTERLRGKITGLLSNIYNAIDCLDIAVIIVGVKSLVKTYRRLIKAEFESGEGIETTEWNRAVLLVTDKAGAWMEATAPGFGYEKDLNIAKALHELLPDGGRSLFYVLWDGYCEALRSYYDADRNVEPEPYDPETFKAVPFTFEEWLQREHQLTLEDIGEVSESSTF